MTVESIKETLTIFSDISLVELKDLLTIKSSPILVVNKSLEIMGILNETLFWKNLALKGDKNQLSECLDYNFIKVSNLSELDEGAIEKYDHFIIKCDKDYICYNAYEVKELLTREKLNSLSNLYDSLMEQLELSRKKNYELLQIINSSYDEIYVTDAHGNTLFVSESCKRFTGLPPEAYINKNIYELEEKGIIVNSVTKKTLQTKKVHSAEQEYPNGKTVFATSKPVFDEEGKLYRIITNSRDISELIQMKNKLSQANALINQTPNNKTSKKRVFYNKLITQSDNMISAIDLAEKVAPTDSSIFIHGESGVGKGVLAKIIHEISPRKKKNFVQLNCGAIPANLIESELFGYVAGAFTGANKQGKPGLVEMADGGTLFLDEIGEMPLDLQVKLLHLVQEKTFKRIGDTKEKKVDIRIISATNKDLKQMIENGTFRQDLYYRLHVVPILIPPLKERKNDILLLIDHFLDKFNKKYSKSIDLDDSSKLLLQLHEWPGNVRELENLIERIVVTSHNPVISIENLPDQFNQDHQNPLVKVSGIMSLKKAVEETEKQILSYALTKYKTTRKMAKALDVNQTTIMRKLRKYQMSTTNKVES